MDSPASQTLFSTFYLLSSLGDLSHQHAKTIRLGGLVLGSRLPLGLASGGLSLTEFSSFIPYGKPRGSFRG
jgi:hypothetical protein